MRQQAEQPRRRFQLAVTFRDDDKVVGSCGIRRKPENDSEADLLLDRKTIAAYQERLARLQEELSRNCRRAHAPFVKLIAEDGLTALCRKELCTAGMLRPA